VSFLLLLEYVMSDLLLEYVMSNLLLEYVMSDLLLDCVLSKVKNLCTGLEIVVDNTIF
jgi:hypothetical protein